jgi:hypothetical protein
MITVKLLINARTPKYAGGLGVLKLISAGPLINAGL